MSFIGDGNRLQACQWGDWHLKQEELHLASGICKDK